MGKRNAWSQALRQCRGRYGDLFAGMLVEVALRLMALAPLLSLLAPKGSSLRWLCLLTPALYLLFILPLRFSMAQAMGDFLKGGRFCSPRLVSLGRYGQKLGQGLKNGLFLLLWALPLGAGLGFAAYMFMGGGGIDALTLVRMIMKAGALIGGSTLEGLLLICAALAALTLPLAYGLCRMSSQRYLWAAGADARALRGGRWQQLGWGLVSLLLLAPFVGVLGYLVFNLALTFVKTFKLPAVMPAVLWAAGAFALLYLPLLPFRRLLTACYTQGRLARAGSQIYAA